MAYRDRSNSKWVGEGSLDTFSVIEKLQLESSLALLGVVFDLVIYKQYLVVVTQQGVLEVYKDYQLVKRVSNMSIPTVYNYGPGLQCDQFSRVLNLIPSGLVFFVVAKNKNNVVYLDLEKENLPVDKIPSIEVETITCLHVHACNLKASILESNPLKSTNML
jgi:hypothetical protein